MHTRNRWVELTNFIPKGWRFCSTWPSFFLSCRRAHITASASKTAILIPPAFFFWRVLAWWSPSPSHNSPFKNFSQFLKKDYLNLSAVLLLYLIACAYAHSWSVTFDGAFDRFLPHWRAHHFCALSIFAQTLEGERGDGDAYTGAVNPRPARDAGLIDSLPPLCHSNPSLFGFSRGRRILLRRSNWILISAAGWRL